VRLLEEGAAVLTIACGARFPHPGQKTESTGSK
jgi:hypothetical protein